MYIHIYIYIHLGNSWKIVATGSENLVAGSFLWFLWIFVDCVKWQGLKMVKWKLNSKRWTRPGLMAVRWSTLLTRNWGHLVFYVQEMNMYIYIHTYIHIDIYIIYIYTYIHIYIYIHMYIWLGEVLQSYHAVPILDISSITIIPGGSIPFLCHRICHVNHHILQLVWNHIMRIVYIYI